MAGKAENFAGYVTNVTSRYVRCTRRKRRHRGRAWTDAGPVDATAASPAPMRFVVAAARARVARERSTPRRTSRQERAGSLPTSSKGSRRTWLAPLLAGDCRCQDQKQKPCAARPVAQDDAASAMNREPPHTTATQRQTDNGTANERTKKNRPGFTRAVFRIGGLAARTSLSAAGRPSDS